MKSIAIVYDSKYGRTEQLAKAIASGVNQVQSVQSTLIKVDEISKNWKLLSNAHGIIFGSPTYFGGASAEFKRFMESSSIFFTEQKWKNKFAAGFTCSGAASGDKLATIIQLAIFAAQHSMHWINLGIGKAGDSSQPENESNLNRFGCWMGAVGQPFENTTSGKALPPADLATARYLGQRVAEICSLV